jgi:hypothetical protein
MSGKAVLENVRRYRLSLRRTSGSSSWLFCSGLCTVLGWFTFRFRHRWRGDLVPTSEQREGVAVNLILMPLV